MKLKDICSFQSGGTPSKSNPAFFHGTIPWITTVALNGKTINENAAVEWITEQAVSESAAKIVPAYSIMVGTRVGVGKTAINSVSMATSQDVISLIGIDETVWNISYVNKLIQSKSAFLNSQARGATIKGIKTEVLADITINEISKEEQESIVLTLDNCQKIIDARRRELANLDDLIKARFVEMFGDPISNPKGWNMIELGALTGVGSSKRIFEKEYVSEGVPFYRTKEIVELSKGNSITTELFITEERYAEIKEQYGVPEAGDLLISAVGTIGVIWIVDGKNDFYYKDGNLIRVDGSDAFDSVYMKNLLEHLISEYKKQMSSGTAYAALTISGLTKMKVYDAPMNLQIQFSDFVAQVDKSKFVVQQALDKAQLLFDSLMQQYFG